MRLTLALCLLGSSVVGASSIDKQLVAKVISSKNAAFRACYDAALAREGPGFEGKAQLTLSVDAQGAVTKVDVAFPLPSETFTACLRDAALSLRFPKFGNGEQVRLTWPITFKAAP